jgi:ribosomal protein S18 acetylase RimI-like enzyme
MTGDITWRQIDEGEIERIIATLEEWQGPLWYGGGLQAGDLGWQLRFGRETVTKRTTEFVDVAGATRIVMLMDSGGFWWFAMDPAYLLDESLAVAIGRWVETLPSDEPCMIDGPHSPSPWRRELAMRGFALDDELFAHFWMPLRASDAVDVPGVLPVRSEQDIADRVTVQRGAFDNSTFTVERWHAMASGPRFRAELDLVARTETGEPASALTAWFGGEGRCAMIEPMGTHRDFRQQGHGTRVLRAAASVLAGMGASGVTVMTYTSSPAALAVYRAAGFRRVGTLAGMVRSAREPSSASSRHRH